jgi:hypothetical protein
MTAVDGTESMARSCRDGVDRTTSGPAAARRGVWATGQGPRSFGGAGTESCAHRPATPASPPFRATPASEGSGRASEMLAAARLSAVAGAGACSTAKPPPDIHEATARRVRAATRRDLRRGFHPAGEPGDGRRRLSHGPPRAPGLTRDGMRMTQPCRSLPTDRVSGRSLAPSPACPNRDRNSRKHGRSITSATSWPASRRLLAWQPGRRA